ncbi:MAG TPA: tetratricopeptide repeat protein [Polyangia bacterium]|nr:tetratricopeptide repeat protein [Polyangia bacterium]
MTTADLHPEDMLDAARRGTLAGAAVSDLRAHLDRCAACRVSLTLPDDLRAEAAPTAADAALLARLVQGALASEAPSVAARGRGRFMRRAAIALALLLVGGSAGAAIWSAGGARFARRFLPEVVPLPRETPARVAPPEVAPKPAQAVVEPIAPPVVAEAPAPRPAKPHPHARTVAVEAAPTETADEIFADANRARRAGDDARALRRYAELSRAFPGSRQEMTARVIVGDLSLGRGAARDALTSFDSYLAANPDGTLAEEARVGRARALEELGRADEEREAWRQLLRRHPDSVQTERARERLRALGE